MTAPLAAVRIEAKIAPLKVTAAALLMVMAPRRVVPTVPLTIRLAAVVLPTFKVKFPKLIPSPLMPFVKVIPPLSV